MSPYIVGLFLGSISKQLEIRSRIKPNSFFLSRISAFANDYIIFLLISGLLCYYPGNLGG